MNMINKIKARQRVERTIARRVVKDAIAAGYEMTINNGGDGNEIEWTSNFKDIVKAMFATDEESLFLRKNGRMGWVRFIYGNDGWDVVNNYTYNIKEVMEGANKLAEKYES